MPRNETRKVYEGGVVKYNGVTYTIYSDPKISPYSAAQLIGKRLYLREVPEDYHSPMRRAIVLYWDAACQKFAAGAAGTIPFTPGEVG